jgi:hypothetical protein
MPTSSDTPLRPSLAQRYFLWRARAAFATHQQETIANAWNPARHFVVENGRNQTVTEEAGHALRVAALRGEMVHMKRLIRLLDPHSGEGREALISAIVGHRPESVRLLRRWGVPVTGEVQAQALRTQDEKVMEALKGHPRHPRF